MDDDVHIRIAEALDDLGSLKGGSPGLDGAPSLSEWRVIRQDGYAFLTGTIEGHPRIRDGRFARTSILVALSSDRTWARTLSRYYRLLQSAAD